jgi:hypothetical protein
MSFSYLLPNVVCKNCPWPQPVILLPYPNPPRMLEDQPAWPRDDWTANFGCHECESAFVCFAEDVRWSAFEDQFLDRLRKNPSFFRLYIECAESSCRSPILVHMYIGSSTRFEDATRTLYVPPTIVCSNGHSARTPAGIAGIHEESGPIV